MLEAEDGPIPMSVRVRHVLKYAKRAQGLRCVALPNHVPEDARPDQAKDYDDVVAEEREQVEGNP